MQSTNCNARTTPTCTCLIFAIMCTSDLQSLSDPRTNAEIWRSHVCPTHSCVQFDSLYVWHDTKVMSHLCMCDVKWLIHMCGMTHSYVNHDSFICKPWLIHMWTMTHSYVCNLTHSYLCDITQLCHTHSYLWHDSFICVPWLIHMCAMTHSCV